MRYNLNSKTLILKDSNIMSIWTYLTASPCYTTNTNKHDNNTNKYYKRDQDPKEVGEGGDYTYRYTVITRVTPALRCAVMRDVLMFH